MARKLRGTKTAEARLSEREHEPSDGGGIHLLIDELKRWQVMPTELSNLRNSGKRSGGDDRVFEFFRAVARAELAERDRFPLLKGGFDTHRLEVRGGACWLAIKNLAS